MLETFQAICKLAPLRFTNMSSLSVLSNIPFETLTTGNHNAWKAGSIVKLRSLRQFYVTNLPLPIFDYIDVLRRLRSKMLRQYGHISIVREHR